jgi:hypothetical protein
MFARPVGEDDRAMELAECIVVTPPEAVGLEALAAAVGRTVAAGRIEVHDLVLLTRAADRAHTVVTEPAEQVAREIAGDGWCGSRRHVLLSSHDLEHAAVVLAAGSIALVLLVEDRWAALARVLGAAGGSLGATPKIAGGRPVRPGTARDRRPDLVPRVRPLHTVGAGTAAVDVAAQLRELVALVERRVITLEQFDDCRRSLLHAD